MKIYVLGIAFIVAPVILSLAYWWLIGNPSLYGYNGRSVELHGPAMLLGLAVYGLSILQVIVGWLILLVFVPS